MQGIQWEIILTSKTNSPQKGSTTIPLEYDFIEPRLIKGAKGQVLVTLRGKGETGLLEESRD